MLYAVGAPVAESLPNCTLPPVENTSWFAERPVPRPTRGQKLFDSGKKRRHTVKHQVVVVRKRKGPGRAGPRRRVRIAAVSRTFPGTTHDKKVYDRTRAACPPGVRRTGDTAYLGTGLDTPTRRPPRGVLTARPKAGIRHVLSNSFGFGGQNITLIAGAI